MFVSKILAMLAIISLFVADAYAEINKSELAKCAVIEGDLGRLECFDKLAVDLGLNGRQIQPTSISGKGKWEVVVDVNPIDDSKTVTLILDADSGKNRWGKPVFLVARCKSNSTELYIGWNDYLGREANVLTRVGNKEAVTQSWDLSTDSKATFHSKPIQFLKEMLESNKLVAQITPYNESPVTAIFDISGLNNAIKPLRNTCGW